MKRAIVLSGGGAKGAYQIGVWKALRLLGLKYDIVTGTSIGALNGAMMVQKDYFKAKLMWYNINLKMIFNEEIIGDFKTFSGKVKVFKMYLSNLLKGGIAIEQIDEVIKQYLNEKRFYKSNIDYGLVTVNLSTFKPILKQKKDIYSKDLKDYLVASAACFPIFKAKSIDDELFIDGSYYDKIPINQAIDMGATEIIAVDLNTIGLPRKIKKKDISVIYIRPRNKIDSFFLFDSKFTRRSIKLGYNDTMKTFGMLDGLKYTFYKGDLKRNFAKCYYKMRKRLLKIGINNLLIKRKTKILLNELSEKEEVIAQIIDYLGERFQIDDSAIYRISGFNKQLIKKMNAYEDFNIALIEEKINKKETIKLADRIYLIKYFYNILNKKGDFLNYLLFFEKDFLAALYLWSINGGDNNEEEYING